MMEEKKAISETCEKCKHFYLHYVRVGKNKYTPLLCGHCSEPRARDKKVDTPACHRYAKRREGRSG